MVPGEVNGTTTNTTAAELEFPNAQTQYGGPQPLDRYQLGGPSVVLNPSNVNISQGSGFQWAALTPNYKPSTVQEWSLTMARELPWHTGFQLSYIGNYSYNLLDQDPVNYVIPRLECTTAGSPDIPNCEAGVPQARRPYPVFNTSGSGNYDLYYYDGNAHTNELQVQLQHTFGNGLLLQSYFTWGKFLTTSEDRLLGTGGLSPEPAALTPGYSLSAPTTSGLSRSERVNALLAPDSTLPAKTLQINGHYQFPFGKGQAFLGDAHGFLNALVSGYNISAFFIWHSGFYFSPYYSPLASNTYLAPGKTGVLPTSQRNAQHWFDASTYDVSSGVPYAGQTYLVYSDPAQLHDRSWLQQHGCQHLQVDPALEKSGFRL